MHVLELLMREVAAFGPREWFMVGVASIFYLMPTIMSFIKNSRYKFLILAINLFLGWSGLAWLLLMLLAVFGKKMFPNLEKPPAETEE